MIIKLAIETITRRAASETSGTRCCLEVLCATKKKEVSNEPTVARVST